MAQQRTLATSAAAHDLSGVSIAFLQTDACGYIDEARGADRRIEQEPPHLATGFLEPGLKPETPHSPVASAWLGCEMHLPSRAALSRVSSPKQSLRV
jgi:hypothetical protein